VPDIRPLSRALSRPVRAFGDVLGRIVGDIRKQAPGARMVGEFAVKMGMTELGKRVIPEKKDVE